jgi:hypothetical protein
MTLDFCRFRTEEATWSDLLPVQGVQAILAEQEYHGPVALRFEFQSEVRPSKCAVVIEQADRYAIQVNGKSVAYEGQAFYRDKCFLPVDVTHCVKRGTNRVDLATRFEAADREHLDNDRLERYYGTELEQVYLIGEFAVRGQRIGRDFFETERHRYKPAFVLTEESGVSTGDLLADGYCFFNGTITLTANPVIPEMGKDEKCYLELGQLGATLAKVRVNGQHAGAIAWRPYRLEITDQVRKGKNRIEISLTNSLRNLLGGLHFVPLGNMPGGQWSQKARPHSVNGPHWYRNRGENKTWSDDYFFRPLGVGSNARITCERHA